MGSGDSLVNWHSWVEGDKSQFLVFLDNPPASNPKSTQDKALVQPTYLWGEWKRWGWGHLLRSEEPQEVKLG